MLSFIPVAALLISAVSAHFELDYPPARGPFVGAKEVEFCSGYPVGARSPFPISGGRVDTNSHHATANFVILISFDADPQNFGDFNQTESGQFVPYLKPFLQLQGAGEACIPVDVASLNINGVTSGTNATILVQYTGGSVPLYQCADVTLTNDTTVVPPPCTNGTTVVGISATNNTATNATTTAHSGQAPATVFSSPVSLAGGLVLLAAAFSSLL